MALSGSPSSREQRRVLDYSLDRLRRFELDSISQKVETQTSKPLSIRVKLHPVVLREHFEMFWHRYFALDPEALITEKGVCGA